MNNKAINFINKILTFLPLNEHEQNIESKNLLKIIKILDLKILIKNTKISNKQISLDYLEKVEYKPLEICKDDSSGNFIKSLFNSTEISKDLDKNLKSYRSPWTNKYFPETENPKYPVKELREIEITLNEFFKTYSKLYYGNNAVSSVFVWEQGDNLEEGFLCAILIKNKISSSSERKTYQSEYDSISLIDIKFHKRKNSVQVNNLPISKQEKQDKVEKNKGLKVFLKIKTTLVYKININQGNKSKNSDIKISGKLNKLGEDIYIVNEYLDIQNHLEKIGKSVENIENTLRIQLEEIHVKKSSEVS